jgi:hypothetical protein
MSGYFVATEDFIDETDGSAIKKGVTFVSAEADVYRLHPERFKPVERAACVPGLITRVGGMASLAGHPVSRPRPRRVEPAIARTRPKELTYKDTQLLERGFVDFEVALGSGARETILAEIQRVQREVGEVECGGFLFAQHRPRASSKFATVAFASGPLPGSRASSRSLEIGSPLDAQALAREVGLEEPWIVVGDWHCHTIRGSELPSMQDARAWVGVTDHLAREAWIGLLVSPSAEMGWMCPKFSAFLAGRDFTQTPSRPMVGRTHLG